MRNFFVGRVVLAMLVGLASLVSVSVSAQTIVPQTSRIASPQWSGGDLSPAPSQYPTPEEACQATHAAFNPGAPYIPATYVNWQTWACHWDMTSSNAGPIWPSVVFITCSDGLGASSPGICVGTSEYEPACATCGGGLNPVSHPTQPAVGDPVELNYAALRETETDYVTADGLFGVTRDYRSRVRDPLYRLSTSEIAGFGEHWHGLIPGRLAAVGNDEESIEYLTTDGDRRYFKISGYYPDRTLWVYGSAAGNRGRLSMVTVPSVDRVTYFQSQASVANGPGEMRLDFPNGDYILFRRSGSYQAGDQLRYLVPIERGDAGGYKIFYDYPDTGEFPNVVRDNFGRQMTLTWVDAVQLDLTIPGGAPAVKVITQIVLPDATKLAYTYGYGKTLAGAVRKDRLEQVQHLDAAGTTVLWARSYLHENGTYPYSITGKTDQNSARLATFGYDTYNRATSTEEAGGANHYTIGNYTYSGDTRYTVRQVTNPLGRREDYLFYNGGTNYSSPQLLQSITGLATANVPADSKSFTYNGYIADYNTTSFTDARGNSFGLGNDAALRPTFVNDAYNTAQARGTNLTWDPVFDLVTREVRGSLQIDYVYSTTGLLQSRTETDITSQSVPYSTNGQTRTWTYGWSTKGRLLSVNGPKGLDAQGKDDTFTFTYDATQGKDLLTVTNGLGQVTTFAGHEANGRPATMTDANGIITAFTYDALGRTTVINRKHPTTSSLDAITTLDYDVEGRVNGMTLPSTDKLFIDYDLAGRMTAVRAASGERIDYGYDAMGNVTSETTKRVDTTTARAITRTFDELGRMLTETLGTGRTTTWAYDKNGNPTQVTTPRSNATAAAFDPLNRLISTTAPNTGLTTLAYNPRDEATSTSDPVSVTTSFVRNGFGEVIQEVSPDRGTSTYYYDAAGDMTASIDGRGQRIDTVRDALGRVKTKTPVGKPASEIVTYTYDSAAITGSYGVGRLATVVDGTGTTKFKYDHRGNLLIKQQTIGTTTAANLTYIYDLADRITQIAYPSGRLVDYLRDSKGRVTTVRTKKTASVTSWTNLATTLTYEPFASLKSATLGNTLSLTQDWGNDGRLASKRLYKTSSGVNRSLLTYGYDNDDNITAITDGVDGTKSVTFSYDTMDRLSQSVAQTGSIKREDYLFDLNGNRTSVEQRTNAGDALPVSTSTYARTSGTNRLASVTSPAGVRAVTYDGRGNTASETRPASAIVTTGYDGHGRLTSYVRTGDPSQTNVYNGLDDRVTVTSGSTTRRYLYDADGRLLGEYGASASAANVVAETIWLSPEVSGASQPFGGDDGVMGYAPLAVSVGSTGTLNYVHGSHLGVPLVTTNTSGTAITPGTQMQPGFPGQLRTFADLYYNRYRDYDSSTGRYIQADPIGLEGDPNPYLYALGNPVTGSDPWGLNAITWGIRGAAIGGEMAGEGLWILCQRYPARCMATIGAAAVWVYHAVHPGCPDQAPVLEMARGGKRNIKNEITRELIANRTPDPCKLLREMRLSETDPKKLKKIKEAEKYFDCDGKGRFR